MDSTLDDILMHYGMPRRSGRYPWGSGDTPYQHTGDFLSRVDELRNQNFTFTDPRTGKTYTGDMAIAKSMNLSSTQFRTQLSIANNERRKLAVDRAKSLRQDGKSLNEIAAIMGYKNDSSVRSLLNASSEARMIEAQKTAEVIKKHIDEKGMIDVGIGVEKNLGVSRERLEQALYILKEQGYPTYTGGIPQVTNAGQQTNRKVICPPGTPFKEIYNFDNVNYIDDVVSHDGGDTFDPKWVYPESMDSKRIKIRYAEEGGSDKDGVVEIRRNVPDLDMGESHYAQVRILVDGTHYIKGMAIYSDDIPEGSDIVFNTNKHVGTPMLGPKENSVLKPIKNDPENPFGSLIKEGITDPDDPTSKGGGQSYYIDKDGKKKLSLINKRSEEGDWDEWSNKLSSQFLAKQPMQLINKQLDMSIADKEAEYADILALTNPTVKKNRLEKFAEDCDSAAVHLKAAALPRQRYQVILPLTTIKDNEVYAPNYINGETVALVRYPHGGTFEIPILKVNNKLKEGIDVYGKNPKDAVGVSKKTADILSGADFDGDTVMVIPCNSQYSKVKIQSSRLKDLEGFDAKFEYGGKPEGTYKKMKNTQNEMGIVSNLIMDMTLKGAHEDEIVKAVKHSMVVIDAEKHGLDYKQSEKDFDIAALKKKYQGRVDPITGEYHEGASTLITSAKSPVPIQKRKGGSRINQEGKPWYDPDMPEGALVWKKTEPEYYVNKSGKTVMRTQDSTKMAETKDARTLSSGTLQEEAYAKYANRMKELANSARLEMVKTGDIKYSPSANKTYNNEAKTLISKLNVSLMNAPRERQAQSIANSVVSAKRKENPDLNRKEIKKLKQQELTRARAKVGAKRHPIEITDREWEAIQAGAISANQLTQILRFADPDRLSQLATPRNNKGLSEAKQNKIHAMKASGYTNEQIAQMIGVSASTVVKYL